MSDPKSSTADSMAEEIVGQIYAIATYALDPLLTREDVIEHVDQIYDLTADFLDGKDTMGRRQTMPQTTGVDLDADSIGSV